MDHAHDNHVHIHHALVVAGPAPATEPVVAGPREQVVDGVRINLTGNARAGEDLGPDSASTLASPPRHPPDRGPVRLTAATVVTAPFTVTTTEDTS